jgi:hypothetical protein
LCRVKGIVCWEIKSEARVRARAGDDNKSENEGWRSVDSDSKSDDWRERARARE